MHDLEFDLSRSLRVEVIGAIRKSRYDLPLVNNSKYMPVCCILQDIATQNMLDLEFDLLWPKLMVPLESPHITSYQ